MESAHVAFDDKMIQGWLDEGFHDALEFQNEVEEMNYESNDEDEQGQWNENLEMQYLLTTLYKMDKSAVDVHSESSIDV